MTLSRGSSGPAAAQVLELVRAGASVSRDEVAALGDLSPATVRRAAASLLQAGLLRERADAAREGAVGRPGVLLEVATDTHVVIGVSVSRTRATVALGDLTGRVVGHATAARDPHRPLDLELLSRVAARLLGKAGVREPLAMGLIAPWAELGEDADEAAAQLHDLSGLPVRTGDLVGAAAAADHFQRRGDLSGHTLYVYAADTVGWAMVSNRVTRTEYFRGCTLAHFPTGVEAACACGRTGCLEVVAGEDRFAERLHARGIVGAPTADAVRAACGDPEVLAALRGRARLLGRTAAAIRDMMGPARLVLVGSALTAWPDAAEDLLAELHASEPLGEIPVELAAYGSGEAQAACTVALGPLYEDPLALTQHLLAPLRLQPARGA